MGQPMVDRLLDAGYDVQVADRSEAVLDQLAAAGATPVTSIPAAAGGAAGVVICVYSDEQVREVALQHGLLDSMNAGSVLIVHTTGSPSTAQDLAKHGAERGVHVVDAAVSGGPAQIAAGEITLFVGGESAAVELARPILNTYAHPILHVGGTGAGQMVKLLNNALFAANITLVMEAASIAVDAGLSEPDLLAALQHGSSDSRALGMIAGTGSAGGFADTVREFLGKDVAVVRQVAADLGVDLGAVQAVLDSSSGSALLGAHASN